MVGGARKAEKMARENIIRCLQVDEQEAERIAKASWVQFGPMIMEVLRYPELIKNGKMYQHVSIEGLEYLLDAVRAGKGALLPPITAIAGKLWERPWLNMVCL